MAFSGHGNAVYLAGRKLAASASLTSCVSIAGFAWPVCVREQGFQAAEAQPWQCCSPTHYPDHSTDLSRCQQVIKPPANPGDRPVGLHILTSTAGVCTLRGCSVLHAVDSVRDCTAAVRVQSPRSNRNNSGSFMLNSTYATPRANSVRTAASISGILPAGDMFDDTQGPMAAYPPDEHQVKRPTITGRRNIRNFRFRKARTDFETWEQAEAALQNGVSVEELVRREFARDFGEDQVQCASWSAAGVCRPFSRHPA